MKKILFAAMMMAMMVFASCGSDKAATPEDVVNESMELLKNQDYEAYVKLLDIKVKEGEDLEARRAEVATQLKGLADAFFGAAGGLKSWTIDECTIAEDGKTAKAKITRTFGNGESDEHSEDLVLGDDGVWRLESDK